MSLEDTLMGKLCRLRFDEGPHRYFLSTDNVEQELPSVTRMLAGLGLVDTSHFTDEHKHNGSARHLATELDDLGQLDEQSLDPMLEPAVRAWRQFIVDAKFQNHHIEVRGFSEEYKYACTIDRVGTWGGKLAIVDIKGASQMRSYPLQLYLYKQAWEELTGQQIERVACVHLLKDGRSKASVYDDDTLAEELAKYIPALYQWRAGGRLLDDYVAMGAEVLGKWATRKDNRIGMP